MIERDCACERFERLEGAAMQIYISDLLERIDGGEETAKTWYRCRRCDALWKQRADKASLMHLAAELDI